MNDFDTGLYIPCAEGDTLPGTSSRVTTNHFPLTPFTATVRSARTHPPSLTLTDVPATLTAVAVALRLPRGTTAALQLVMEPL